MFLFVTGKLSENKMTPIRNYIEFQAPLLPRKQVATENAQSDIAVSFWDHFSGMLKTQWYTRLFPVNMSREFIYDNKYKPRYEKTNPNIDFVSFSCFKRARWHDVRNYRTESTSDLNKPVINQMNTRLLNTTTQTLGLPRQL